MSNNNGLVSIHDTNINPKYSNELLDKIHEYYDKYTPHEEALSSMEKMPAGGYDMNITDLQKPDVNDMLKFYSLTDGGRKNHWIETQRYQIWTAFFENTGVNQFLTPNEMQEFKPKSFNYWNIMKLRDKTQMPLQLVISRICSIIVNNIYDKHNYVKKTKLNNWQNYMWIDNEQPAKKNYHDEIELSHNGKILVATYILFIQLVRGQSINKDDLFNAYTVFNNKDINIDDYISYVCYKKGSVKITIKDPNDVLLMNQWIGLYFANKLPR